MTAIIGAASHGPISRPIVPVGRRPSWSRPVALIRWWIGKQQATRIGEPFEGTTEDLFGGTNDLNGALLAVARDAQKEMLDYIEASPQAGETIG